MILRDLGPYTLPKPLDILIYGSIYLVLRDLPNPLVGSATGLELVTPSPVRIEKNGHLHWNYSAGNLHEPVRGISIRQSATCAVKQPAHPC